MNLAFLLGWCFVLITPVLLRKRIGLPFFKQVKPEKIAISIVNISMVACIVVALNADKATVGLENVLLIGHIYSKQVLVEGDDGYEHYETVHKFYASGANDLLESRIFIIVVISCVAFIFVNVSVYNKYWGNKHRR